MAHAKTTASKSTVSTNSKSSVSQSGSSSFSRVETASTSSGVVMSKRALEGAPVMRAKTIALETRVVKSSKSSVAHASSSSSSRIDAASSENSLSSVIWAVLLLAFFTRS